MTSVLSNFASQWLRSSPRVARPAFGRRPPRALSVTLRLVLARAYRAMIDARMRRIRMELALHGVRYDADAAAGRDWRSSRP
ncbi:hypothetical protein JQ557_17505 [Bradyrhizobium sp. U87765 SZCCT0131]|uniref:hypothetical protein n=1 Tax=unclassified Bradyrhizobium TaxID=2631580 RepID=UPI001BA783C0|nr:MULTISPECIES: hypothetical protein [unclassified Bradyrhizobium]MBR1219809.1 hypothetical protein [Bradyrhizobium sp. U87765 SZCCT0131]MBR1262460.1 hypothetical protein [Bradyrhizobium sp. U87765 SZCCT0134]MBR1308357.1 hypothetical protein [Bradyrhizobium sp. U87765 SZCCT0110]MBR1318242.1 hypothetical protein [Bradyrhizobium sp. U87765 SZCCT0109]MBR1351945.1 hypothetical protein [Bradyrhizobium sp. U87765 SZCCT0048]